MTSGEAGRSSPAERTIIRPTVASRQHCLGVHDEARYPTSVDPQSSVRAATDLSHRRVRAGRRRRVARADAALHRRAAEGRVRAPARARPGTDRRRASSDAGHDRDAAISKFRQSNQFFYLTGVEVPRAMLLMDGRDEGRHALPRRRATSGWSGRRGRCSPPGEEAAAADRHRRACCRATTSPRSSRSSRRQAATVYMPHPGRSARRRRAGSSRGASRGEPRTIPGTAACRAKPAFIARSRRRRRGARSRTSIRSSTRCG